MHEEGRLSVPSMVRADKILHVERSVVEPSFARLGDASFDRVSEVIAALLRRAKT